MSLSSVAASSSVDSAGAPRLGFGCADLFHEPFAECDVESRGGRTHEEQQSLAVVRHEVTVVHSGSHIVECGAHRSRRERPDTEGILPYGSCSGKIERRRQDAPVDRRLSPNPFWGHPLGELRVVVFGQIVEGITLEKGVPALRSSHPCVHGGNRIQSAQAPCKFVR
jgi:hypothetical protein